MAAAAAACGSTTTSGGSTKNSSSGSANPLAGQPLENHLEIYNWSEYDDPSTFTKFTKLPAEAKVGMTTHETFYSSNDELLAKLHAGGTSYDIIVPSQNAVAELIQEKGLMALDKALLPNLKNLDPSFLKPSYVPTGDYHVIKDFGIPRCSSYDDKMRDRAAENDALTFPSALPKFGGKGRHQPPLERASEDRPPRADGHSAPTNTTIEPTSNEVKLLPALDPQGSHRHRLRRATSTTPSPARSFFTKMERRRVTGSSRARKEQGAHHRGHSRQRRQDVGGRPGSSRERAAHPVAAHAWINWLLTDTTVTEMNYHNYKIPMPSALAQLPASLRDDPMFNIYKTYTDNYHYILTSAPTWWRAAPRSTRSSRPRDGGRREATARRPPSGGRRTRSFKPRYPAWLAAPSLLYYAIFFLGPMAILVAFSLAIRPASALSGTGSTRPSISRSPARCTSPSSSARWSWPRSAPC